MSKQMGDAIWSSDTATLAELLLQGEDPNAVDEQSGLSALMHASEHDLADAVKMLLAAGADPTYAMANGWTALHHAVDTECDAQSQGVEQATGRFVKLLVAAGADPDAIWQDTANRSQSPRTMAANYGYEAVLTALNHHP
jgi:ankyrin repeat protein